MRIALCLSGLTRSIEYTINSIFEQFIDKFQCDVFIHTWDINNVSNDERFKNPPILSTQSKQDFFENVKNRCPNYFKIMVENINSDWNYLNYKHIKNIVPMYYGIFKSNQLKTQYEKNNKMTYDLVIRSRLDSWYENSIDKSEINSILKNKSKLFFTVNRVYKEMYNQESRNNFLLEGTDNYFVPDNFAFGSSDVMDIYSDVYPNIGTIQKKIKSDFSENVPECYLGSWLFSNKVQLERSSCRYRGPISWENNQIIFETDYEEGRKLYGVQLS